MANTPHTPRGAAGGTHHPSWRPPLTHDELAALRCRPSEWRTEIPLAGDVVGYREQPGGPIVAATVVAVQPMEGQPTEPQPDPNIWRVAVVPGMFVARAGEHRLRHYELVDDPWPQLTLRIDPHRDPKTGAVKGRRTFVQTREARLAGEPGWYPSTAIDWS